MTEHIKRKAIKVSIGTKVTFPLNGGVIHTLISVPDTPKTYNRNNDCITFVDEDGDTFAIPALKGVEETLISDGYKKDTEMPVFFSSIDSYPTESKAKWDALLNEMRVL